jgi:putative transposon-encoded protein
MSKKEPIEIEFKNKKIIPELVYEGTVVKSGNGAVIKSYKRFMGRMATIIVRGDKK